MTTEPPATTLAKRPGIWPALGFIGLLAGAILAIHQFRAWSDMGAFRTIEPHGSLSCQAIPAPGGSEDVAIDRENSLAYVSAGDWRANGLTDAMGIYVLDLQDPGKGLAKLPLDGFEGKLRPLGLGLWANPEDGGRSLLVVNRAEPQQPTVEIFDVETDRLVYRETIESHDFVALNDVVAVGPRAFYATNDHGTRPDLTIARFLEDFIPRSLANVVYFDGQKTELAVEGLTVANGIAASPDLATIYVTESRGFRSLLRFDRNRDSGALTLKTRVPLLTALDNADVDETGSVWLAGHPKITDLRASRADPAKKAPAQIIKVTPNADGTGGAVEEVFLDTGEKIAAASVAARDADRLIIGVLFDPVLHLCRLPAATPAN